MLGRTISAHTLAEIDELLHSVDEIVAQRNQSIYIGWDTGDLFRA